MPKIAHVGVAQIWLTMPVFSNSARSAAITGRLRESIQRERQQRSYFNSMSAGIRPRYSLPAASTDHAGAALDPKGRGSAASSVCGDCPCARFS